MQLEELSKLSDIVRGLHKPVISDDMVMLLRSGKRVEWEPATFAQLEKAGIWDGLPFETRIKQGDFAMFITEGNKGGVDFNSRYSTAIADAMDEAYPIKKTIAGFTLHLPSTLVKLDK
jgi:hypothetical protein